MEFVLNHEYIIGQYSIHDIILYKIYMRKIGLVMHKQKAIIECLVIVGRNEHSFFFLLVSYVPYLFGSENVKKKKRFSVHPCPSNMYTISRYKLEIIRLSDTEITIEFHQINCPHRRTTWDREKTYTF